MDKFLIFNLLSFLNWPDLITKAGMVRMEVRKADEARKLYQAHSQQYNFNPSESPSWRPGQGAQGRHFGLTSRRGAAVSWPSSTTGTKQHKPTLADDGQAQRWSSMPKLMPHQSHEG